ncbi:MAG: hypothetical protein AB1716_06535 [Planctomycetota bacterium]
MPAAERGAAELALTTALDFALAIGQADGERAARLLDATGYQILPEDGPLPEQPPKPLMPAAVARAIGARPRVEVGKLQLAAFEVQRADSLRAIFPAVARWMLPTEDYAIVFHPPAGEPVPNWVMRHACIVVRIRADKPAILGGNLLAVLADSAEQFANPPEDK